MRVSLIAACGVVLLFACSGGGERALGGLPKGRAAQGTLEGILHVGNDTEPVGLDPHQVTGVTEHHILTALFEGLVTLDAETLEPLPGVAESWEVSPDGLVYTFHLRANAKWSNGDPVTAKDFAYAWRRILTPELGAEYSYMLHCIRNAEAYNKGELRDFSQVGVRVIDDYTLEVTLKEPTPYFLTMQMHYTYFPAHQGAIEKFGSISAIGTPWTQPGNMVSNGPFKLETWKPNEIITTSVNEYYWDKDSLRLKGVYFYPIDDQRAEEMTFRKGDLHMTGSIPISKIPVYQRENPELLVVHPWMGSYYYRINVTRPPFQDARVRRAFAMAVDRQALVERVTRGGEAPAYCLTPPDPDGYICRSSIPYDPEVARKLLAEAGYPNGEGLPKVELLYNTSENHKLIGEAVQQMLKQNLNARVELVNQDWKVYMSTMENLDYGLARSGWIADFVDPINFLETFQTGNGNNRTGWGSPAYDNLLASARAELDQDKRLELLQQAEGILLEEAPFIPIYFYTRKFLKSPDVQGWRPNLLGFYNYKFLWLEAPQHEKLSQNSDPPPPSSLPRKRESR